MRNGHGYGYHHGFGADASGNLVQGQDFNCNAAICYGIGTSNDALFKQLQQAINQFSEAAGFAPLAVDGFIGSLTVAAVQAIASNLGLSVAPSTKESVAANAPGLMAALALLSVAVITQGQRLSPPGTPVQPSTAQAAATAAGQPPPVIPDYALGPSAPSAAALPTKMSGTVIAVIGGVVAVLLIGGVGYAVYRRKAHPRTLPRKARRG